jgi:hypothetical protein
MLMLVNTRDRWEPEPEPEPEPRWAEHKRRGYGMRLPRPALQLGLGLALALLSSAFPPILAYVLLLAACVCIGRGLGTVTRSTSGLREHRQ